MRRVVKLINQDVSVSIVIPFKDEQDSIPLLSIELCDVMNRSNYKWECIWVDDGSVDNSVQNVKNILQHRSNYSLIEFDRNYGQSAALWYGFKKTESDIIVTIDCDLQNNPHDIPLIVDTLIKSGADMVNGVRRKRNDSIVRKLSSKIGNGFRNFVTNSSVTDVGCSIRAFYRHCIVNVTAFKGMHRFLPTLIEMQGFSIIEIHVDHRHRIKGKTKYGINNRLWVGLIDTLAVKWMQHRLVYPKTKMEICK